MPRSAREEKKQRAILIVALASIPLIILGITIPNLGIALLVMFSLVLFIGSIGWAIVTVFDK